MSNKLLFLDYETRSATDLQVSGLGRYLADKTTAPYCFTFKLPGMTAPDIWTEFQKVPKQVIKHIADGELFVAHNAPFDFWIWNTCHRRILPELPIIKIEQVRCSAVRARYNGLPGSLAGACAAMQLSVQKDLEGGDVMKQVMNALDKNEKTHPDIFARIYKYAIIDTAAMFELWHATKPIPNFIQKQFELDMSINARGFGCDVPAAQAMEEMNELAQAQLDYEITLLTSGGVLAVTEIQKIKEYAKNLGEEIDDASKEGIKKLIERESIPSSVRDMLELRLDASRTPKKPAAILRAHTDGRICHSTVFYGALSGRSTARGAGGIQLLNVARPRPGRKAKDCERYLQAVREKDVAFLTSPEVGPILAALADAQRPLFCAGKPGYVLVGADSSGIEARKSAWLANDEEKLSDYDNGVDGYIKSAMAIYNVTYEQVIGDQRQIGKVGDLALGYGGGDGAFANMAKNYGVQLPEDTITKIVTNWRAARPAYERWWSMLEFAALVALDQPGKEVKVPVGRGFCSEVIFVRDKDALRMLLPSGSAISYHNARLHLQPGTSVPVAIYDKPEGYIETLDRKILSNNLTQKLARDFFWEVMQDISQDYDIVHHVYDEVIVEVKESEAEAALKALLDRLKRRPWWADRLPLNAAGYISFRWRKD